MKWKKTPARQSGYYWVALDEQTVMPMLVEGRDLHNDGWVWLNDSDRLYLTIGSRSECGDEMQDDYWLDWLWLGPMVIPSNPLAK